MSKTLEELKTEFLAEQADELKHYGKKGMRWGRRKAEGSNSASPSKPSREEVYDARATAAKKMVKLQAHRVNEIADGSSMAVYNQTKIDKLTREINEVAKTANKSATGKEKAAKVQAGAAITLAVIGYIGSRAAMTIPSGPSREGAQVISALASTGAIGLAVGSIATKASANKEERAYFQNKA